MSDVAVASPTTRHGLIEAAGELFAELGFRDVTVRQICLRAGANIAAVNYHFRDKESLYREVVLSAYRTARERYPLNVGVTDADPPQKRFRAFYDRYAPDYPREAPRPEILPEGTKELRAAGLTLKLHEMGAGCSEAHLVVEWEGHAFVGDLVANRAHAWLEIGKTPEWHARLDEIASLRPGYVHPGRGTTGGPELLAKQQDYLRAVERAVASEGPKLPRDDGAVDRAKATIVAAYPDYAYPVFLDIGLPAEWERQAHAK